VLLGLHWSGRSARLVLDDNATPEP
jgi:hypothetical protein